jgi:hypothetical protein
MTDLVEELRQGSLNNDDYRWRAAARIEQLEAALRKITDRLEDDFNDGRPMRRYELEKARAALEEPK